MAALLSMDAGLADRPALARAQSVSERQAQSISSQWQITGGGHDMAALVLRVVGHLPSAWCTALPFTARGQVSDNP
jgi:hypothetical protein